MARPKAPIEKKLVKAYVTLPIYAQMQLSLHSEVEGRIPLGDVSKFVEERLREHFEWAELDLHPYGGPEGFFLRGPKEMIEWLRKRLPASLQNPLADQSEAAHGAKS